MEYEKLYLKTFNEVHSNTENYIKNKLIEYINNDYGFNKASNEILEESEKKFETNKFNTTNPYTDLIYIFNNERKKYSKNFNENVFKRDVKPVFDNLNIKGYSFEDLIKDLAEYYSETDTYRIFRNENRLFELIYKSEDFSRFEIKEYDPVLENTEIFNYYRGLVYPESKVTKDNVKVNMQNITTSENDIIYKLNEFEEDEKYLILHALYKVLDGKKIDSKNIELTEFLRIIRICQGIEDISLFEKNYTKKFYKSVSDGLQYSSDLNRRRNLKTKTLAKIKELQIPEIEEYIKSLKS